ncbi:hypothetical protein LMG23992_02623 [Cupriavidus laharis]|uniref:Uncharacterized protein n=1 Tax=Cupriavidus laharis TaxID=151654 RepID=A0ABM8X2G9_9BURK|nr:hypothetical protein [Cupriavidus laharis]CAG9174084.1 hypothetical protein LMG23992_02623 [Cupriavidus laharis]
MTTRQKLHAWTAVACMALAMASGVASADEVPLVTGKQWTESTEQMKKAYLVGIANVVQVDVAYHAGNIPPDSQTIVPRLARGLKGHTLDSVRDGLDRWYAAHPDRLQRPVIETIWFEMVVPGLQGKK